mmetsp:Transcript_15953/g.39099  ORF Transcript_15953/g.39099 Transcript_15953/m.39099 type:complete len:234 (-) Transcript_15953:1554-2255(-)
MIPELGPSFSTRRTDAGIVHDPAQLHCHLDRLLCRSKKRLALGIQNMLLLRRHQLRSQYRRTKGQQQQHDMPFLHGRQRVRLHPLRQVQKEGPNWTQARAKFRVQTSSPSLSSRRAEHLVQDPSIHFCSVLCIRLIPNQNCRPHLCFVPERDHPAYLVTSCFAISCLVILSLAIPNYSQHFPNHRQSLHQSMGPQYFYKISNNQTILTEMKCHHEHLSWSLSIQYFRLLSALA